MTNPQPDVWTHGERQQILAELTGDEYWDGHVEFHGRRIEIDVNCDGDFLEPARLDRVHELLREREALELRAREALRKEYDDTSCESAVRGYESHHLREFDAAKRQRCFGVSEPTAVTKDLFFAALSLVRIGFCPERDSGEAFAVLDFTLGADITNYLCVVKFDEDAGVVDVTTES